MEIGMEFYLDGIQRARNEGLIVVAPRYDADPGVLKYSNHVPWQFNGITYQGILSLTNTRPLHPVIRLVIYLFPDSAIRFLELGPGAGNACYELYRLAKTMGKQVIISAASYSPINPFMPIVLSGSRLLFALRRNPALDMAEQGPQGSLWFIATDAAFDSQNDSGEVIFNVLDEPYIACQYIGNYPRSPDLGEQRFDVIYDMLGPLHGEDEDSLQDAYMRLTERGLLFFMTDPRYALGQRLLEEARKGHIYRFHDSDAVIVDLSSHLVLVAKARCSLSTLLNERMKSRPQTVPISDMIGFLRWLIGDPEGNRQG
jgi:SAM-dependent methyltransferase